MGRRLTLLLAVTLIAAGAAWFASRGSTGPDQAFVQRGSMPEATPQPAPLPASDAPPSRG